MTEEITDKRKKLRTEFTKSFRNRDKEEDIRKFPREIMAASFKIEKTFMI